MKVEEILSLDSLFEKSGGSSDHAGSVGLYIDDLYRRFKAAQQRKAKATELGDLLRFFGELVVYKEQKKTIDRDDSILISLLGYTSDSNPERDLSSAISKHDALNRGSAIAISKGVFSDSIDFDAIYKWFMNLKEWFTNEAKRIGPALRAAAAERNARIMGGKAKQKDRETIAKTILDYNKSRARLK